MSRVTIKSLREENQRLAGQVANYKANYEYTSKACDDHWTARDKLSKEIQTLRQEGHDLRASINALHNHHQQEMIKANQKLAAAMESMSVMSLGALKDLGAISKRAIEETKTKAALSLAELQGQRDGMERAFQYLADRNGQASE